MQEKRVWNISSVTLCFTTLDIARYEPQALPSSCTRLNLNLVSLFMLKEYTNTAEAQEMPETNEEKSLCSRQIELKLLCTGTLV